MTNIQQFSKQMKKYDNRPLVSIIVPVYNTAFYIDQCLSSICNQTLHDIEVVCVNDGSTDESEAIIKNFCARDKRFYLISQNNRGLCEARKTGIFFARGYYIGFVDSDDYVSSDFFECLYQQAYNENADIVATTSIIPFLNTGEILPQKNFFTRKEIPSLSSIERAKFFLNSAIVCNKIYTSEICQKIFSLYNSKENRAEDNTFTIPSLILAKKVSLITKPKYFYRQHNLSICRQPITKLSIQNIYSMYCTLLNTIKYFNLINSDLYIYIKYIRRRRNWECFQLTKQLPSLVDQISFVWKTKDAGFQLSWLLRKLLSVWRNI